MSRIPMNSVSKEFSAECIFKTTVSTTGYCGGDSGHGGRTSITFEDLGGTDISVEFSETPRTRISINVGGDAELRLMIRALRFAADQLNSLAEGESSTS